MSKPKVIILIGLPASGKSHHAERLKKDYNAVLLSSDTIREEIFGDINCQEHNKEVFKILHDIVKDNLINGKNVIYDATNISCKRRMAFLREINKIDCDKIAVLILTPYEKCLEQNKKRDRVVPESVIKRMYLSFDIPYHFEGWDDICVIYDVNNLKDYDMGNVFSELDNLEQDSPYHTLTVGNHCRKAKDYISDKYTFNYKLIMAAFLHDVGKKFTKSFTNKKGEVTKIAHYYNHENVSAYESMLILLYLSEVLSDRKIQHNPFIFNDVLKQNLYISQLIKFHMRAYNLHSDKSYKKLINLVGYEFFRELMILHDADKYAH